MRKDERWRDEVKKTVGMGGERKRKEAKVVEEMRDRNELSNHVTRDSEFVCLWLNVDSPGLI